MNKEIKIMKHSANKHFREWKECQPKPPKIKMLKAWIEIFSIKNTSPDILWKLPTKSEIKTIEHYGGKIYPCVITYQLKKEL